MPGFRHFCLLIMLLFQASSMLWSQVGTSADSTWDSTPELRGAQRFFTPALKPSKARTWAVGGTISGLWAGSSVVLYNVWYRDFPLGRFQGFNDNAEWLQMDKGGHVLNGYFQTVWARGLFHWAGQPEGKAVAYGALTSTVIQSTIEVMDGFSQEWGFSWGDILANTVGTGMAASQQLLWDEQRISIKLGFGPTNYGNLDDPLLTERARALYGTNAAERLLKDYNGLSYWLSVNPHSFLSAERQESTWWPAWLNVAAGYGAENLYGGFENHWCADGESRPEDCAGDLITRYEIMRQRQYLLSLDVDFTKIETNKAWLRTVFGVINLIKVPAPALEYRQGEGFKGHWIYF